MQDSETVGGTIDADEAIDLAVMEDLKREADLPKLTNANQRIYDRIKHEDPYGYEHRFVMGVKR